MSMSASAGFEPPSPPAAHPGPSPVLGRAYPAAFPPEAEPAPSESDATTEIWRRVPLGDDAELLIRESAYRRRPDRVEWLLGWARKVFG